MARQSGAGGLRARLVQMLQRIELMIPTSMQKMVAFTSFLTSLSVRAAQICFRYFFINEFPQFIFSQANKEPEPYTGVDDFILSL